MKNIFAITFGTSDVQIDLTKLKLNGFEFSDTENTITHTETRISIKVRDNRFRGKELLEWPRIDGEVIYKNYKIFKEILKFPLTIPAIEMFLNEKKSNSIDKWLLIYTNQDEKVDAKNRDNDTLYLKEIFKSKIKELYTETSDNQFEEFQIIDHVIDIDKLYRDFEKQCKSILGLPYKEIKQIILLAQGGIDQINQAITLNLIQAFPFKLKQYQKAENQLPKKLNFPDYFLQDLNKQKIKKLLNVYEFGAIEKDMLPDKAIYHLAQYAFKRLNLLYNVLNINTQVLINQCNYSKSSEIIVIPDNESDKLKDQFFSAKIYFTQKKYCDYLWRLFSINENFYRVLLDLKYGDSKKYYNQQNENKRSINNEWVYYLLNINKSLKTYLLKRQIYLNNPNRRAYKAIIEFLLAENNNDFYLDSSKIKYFSKIQDKMEEASDLRNLCAHKLGAVELIDINKSLGPNFTAYNLNNELDNFFEISPHKPFGIYDDIKKDILDLL